MNLALMRCCATQPVLPIYEAATEALLGRLGMRVVELDFNCCGYPLRNAKLEAWVFSSARNLALAERARLDLVTVCSCCFGSLKQAGQLLRRDPSLREAANASMAGERLRWSGSANVRHLLQVLRDDLGLERMRKLRKRSLQGLRVACHYGCHLLRPGQVLELDDPKRPRLLDELIEATGAETVAWDAKLGCCGAPASGVNDDLATDLMARKLASAREAGADLLCVVCPYCHLQLDRGQRRLLTKRGGEALPVVLVQQLLGASLGIDPATLGLGPDFPPPRASLAGESQRSAS